MRVDLDPLQYGMDFSALGVRFYRLVEHEPTAVDVVQFINQVGARIQAALLDGRPFEKGVMI